MDSAASKYESPLIRRPRSLFSQLNPSTSLTTIRIFLDEHVVAVSGFKNPLAQTLADHEQAPQTPYQVFLVAGTVTSSLPTSVSLLYTPIQQYGHDNSCLLVPSYVSAFCGDCTEDAIVLAQASIGCTGCLHVSFAEAQLEVHRILDTCWKGVLFDRAWSMLYRLLGYWLMWLSLWDENEIVWEFCRSMWAWESRLACKLL